MTLESGLRTKLQEICNSDDTPPLLKRRCRAILMADQGLSTSDIARRLGTNASQVSVWRRRFADMGYAGLVNARLHGRLGRQAPAGRARNGNDPSARTRKPRQRGAVARIQLSAQQRQELLGWAKAPLIENRLAQRARAVLQADDGFPAPEIGSRIMMSSVQVLQWCQRYLDEGLAGLKDRPRSGRPARALGDSVERIRALIVTPPPAGRSRWTGTLLAEKLDLPDHLVRRALKAGNINLRQVDSLAEPVDGTDRRRASV